MRGELFEGSIDTSEQLHNGFPWAKEHTQQRKAQLQLGQPHTQLVIHIDSLHGRLPQWRFHPPIASKTETGVCVS
jgi:hypothetical protein